MPAKRNSIIVAFALLAALAPCQELSPLSFQASPAVNVPLAASAENFKIGASTLLSLESYLSSLSLLILRGEAGYALSPTQGGEFVHIGSAGLGAGLRIDMGKFITLKLIGTGGLYYSVKVDALDGAVDGWDPYYAAGGIFSFNLGPKLSLGLGAFFRDYTFLSSGIEGIVSLSFRPVAPKKAMIQQGMPLRPDLLVIESIEWETVFPVFRKYYSDHPIARISFRNGGKQPLSDVAASVYMKQYMDAPYELRLDGSLQPGESRSVELFALLTDAVLDVTEATKAAAQVSLEATLDGERVRAERVETVRVMDRNAMTWDDDRRAAAFVTAKEPQILTFSKNSTGMVKGAQTLSQNLRLAIAIHEALRLHGMSYRKDPRTPYEEFSAKRQDADFLQFPRQTLEYRAGDCDDLSILYCALLESLGVETAFITVPGHILMAFALEVPPEEARKQFVRFDDILAINGKSWIPVETTALSVDFLQAWEQGAMECRAGEAKGERGFYPLQEAWAVYESVGLIATGLNVNPPPRESVEKAYQVVVDRLVEREIGVRALLIEEEIKRSQGSARALNSLGVLYARYGQWARAEAQFAKALAKEEFAPALINMGNLHYVLGEPKKALPFYERAQQIDPANPKLLLALARTNQDLENYAEVKTLYAALKKADPSLAERFAFLDAGSQTAARAADMNALREVQVWSEE